MIIQRRFISTFPFRQFAIALLVLFGSCIAGVASIFIANLTGGNLIVAIALPMTLAVLFLFLVNTQFLINAIFSIRAGADMLLNYTRVGGGAGLGFVFNIVLIASVVRLLVSGDRRVRQALRIWLPYLAISAIAMFYSPDLSVAMKTFIALATFVAAYCVGVSVAINGKRDEYVKLFIVASAIPFVWSIGMALMGAGYITELDGVPRFTGAFGHPNILAFFCVLNCALVLYFVQLRISKGWFGNALVMAHLLQSLGLLLLAKTRSAWAGVILLFLAYAILYRRRYFIYMVLGLGLALTLPEVRERIFGVFEPKVMGYAATSNSYEWRLLLWESALNSLSPLGWVFGNGLGSFVAQSANFFSLSGGTSFGAHSIYVQTIYELGLIGLIIFAIAILSIFNKFMSMLKVEDGIHQARFGLFILLTFFVFGYSDNMFNYTAFNYYFFCVIGMFSTPRNDCYISRSESKFCRRIEKYDV